MLWLDDGDRSLCSTLCRRIGHLADAPGRTPVYTEGEGARLKIVAKAMEMTIRRLALPVEMRAVARRRRPKAESAKGSRR